MLPDAVLPVPASLMTLLAVFSPLFTTPSFRTFTALACGFLAQSGKRTVCGMLTGAALSRLWSHDRAHGPRGVLVRGRQPAPVHRGQQRGPWTIRGHRAASHSVRHY